MTWTNRLRLFGGVLGVILVVALLTLIFNMRQSSSPSLSASVTADSIEVAGAYTGTVSKQFVKDGDDVKIGDKLFTVQSANLRQDLANNIDVSNTSAWTVDKKAGTVTYLATANGTVYDSKATIGNALSPGATFANIRIENTVYVDADYLLTPRDYDRIQQGAAVQILLPNDKTIDGTVTTIAVSTDQGRALADVRVDSKQLDDPALENLTKIGTPVTATVSLRDDGPLAGVNDMTFDFLRKIGLK